MYQGGSQTLKRLKRKTAGLLAAAGAVMLLRTLVRKQYSFRDKSVVITGGSRGLGLELARLFAKQGARLTLIARTAATLEKARSELANNGAQVLAIPCYTLSGEAPFTTHT